MAREENDLIEDCDHEVVEDCGYYFCVKCDLDAEEAYKLYMLMEEHGLDIEMDCIAYDKSIEEEGDQ